MKLSQTQFDGLDALLLSNERYRAVVIPALGANCISLTDTQTGASFLRTPPDAAELMANPNVYGLPLLFPPNRIRDGVFSFAGRSYRFPINEPARSCHIHGVLSVSPFTHIGNGVFRYQATERAPYMAFPHAFTVLRAYTMEDAVFSQTVTVTNDSDQDMPVGVGCHAAWRIPFTPEENPAAYTLQLPAKRRWCHDERFLPTCEYEEDTPFLQALRAGTLRPEAQAISCMLDLRPGDVVLRGEKQSFRMEMTPAFRFMTLWNGGGGKGFICPEPQSWIVDAPNVPLPADQTGFSFLRPGESRQYTFRCRIEDHE